MKRWEEQRRLKAHKKKLKKMKSTINTRSSKKSLSIKKSKMKTFGFSQMKSDDTDALSTTSIDNSFHVNKSQLSEYFDHEKQDLQQIPLYRLLKLYNLQQYAKVSLVD